LFDFLADDGGGEGIDASSWSNLGAGDGGALGRLLSDGKLYLILPDDGS